MSDIEIKKKWLCEIMENSARLWEDSLNVSEKTSLALVEIGIEELAKAFAICLSYDFYNELQFKAEKFTTNSLYKDPGVIKEGFKVLKPLAEKILNGKGSHNAKLEILNKLFELAMNSIKEEMGLKNGLKEAFKEMGIVKPEEIDKGFEGINDEDILREIGRTSDFLAGLSEEDKKIGFYSDQYPGKNYNLNEIDIKAKDFQMKFLLLIKLIVSIFNISYCNNCVEFKYLNKVKNIDLNIKV